MAHLHSQMIVTPFVPNLVRAEMKGAEDYFGMTRRCVFCDMLQRYSDGIQRLVAESPRFLAVCPFAPRFAYEMWVLPRQHSSHFDTITDDEAFELAQLLKKVIRALDRTAPSQTYHWHLEIVPRTARAAGYEWSTGVFINTVMPERAAQELQSAAQEF